jgi:hypothetical protein
MITILPDKTETEKRLIEINDQLELLINNIKSAAFNLNKAMDIFWETEDNLLIEMMNQKGPVEMNNIFQKHAETANGINFILNQRGVDSIASIGMRKPVVLGEDGLFKIVYPEEEHIVLPEENP